MTRRPYNEPLIRWGHRRTGVVVYGWSDWFFRIADYGLSCQHTRRYDYRESFSVRMGATAWRVGPFLIRPLTPARPSKGSSQ